MPDFVMILSLIYCWIFSSSALVLCGFVRVKKKKTRASSWFPGKVNFFENLIFNQFYDSRVLHPCALTVHAALQVPQTREMSPTPWLPSRVAPPFGLLPPYQLLLVSQPPHHLYSCHLPLLELCSGVH